MKKEIEKSIEAGKKLSEYYKQDDLFQACEHKHVVWVCWAHWALTNPDFGIINLCDDLKGEIKTISDSIIDFDFNNKKAEEAAAAAAAAASVAEESWRTSESWEDARAAWSAAAARAVWASVTEEPEESARALWNTWAVRTEWAMGAAWATRDLKKDFETRSKNLFTLIITSEDCIVARDHYLAAGERHKDFLIY